MTPEAMNNFDHVDAGRHVADQMFQLRMMVGQRRQFGVAFDEYGNMHISSPKIGNRTPANPQPTPPVTIAIRRAA